MSNPEKSLDCRNIEIQELLQEVDIYHGIVKVCLVC